MNIEMYDTAKQAAEKLVEAKDFGECEGSMGRSPNEFNGLMWPG